MAEPIRQRLLVQYLEPSPATATTDLPRLRDHLAFALERLPVTDVALGWELRAQVVEALRAIIPAEVSVWRWVPVFTDPDGSVADGVIAVGPDGTAPPPFRDLADFRFLCLDRDEVIESGLSRAVMLANEIDADGVLLDRIRWHSPSVSPASELTCFCERSRDAAAADGLDLAAVARALGEAGLTLAGRRDLVGALLGRPAGGALGDFLDWRSLTVSRSVERLSSGLQEVGLRAALDVFTPALARSVGQDLGTLGDHGEWSKSMTYLEALGPASMPFEFNGYARWLAAAGEPDTAAFLSGVLGFEAPGVDAAGAQLDTLEQQATALASAIGPERAVVGIDAVEIEGVCEIDGNDLDARVGALRQMGVGMSPCWELLLISEGRIDRMASAWHEGRPTDA